MSEPIRIPAAWKKAETYDLLQIEAGLAYVMNQHSRDSGPSSDYDFGHGDHPCWYAVYSDGSIWFHSNAEDEVWSDYKDYVEMDVIPHLSTVTWDEVYPSTQELLLHYHDGDEAEARSHCKDAEEVEA